MNDDSSARIVAGLREWIAGAAPRAQLPSTRQLVAQYAASPVTVQKALHRLVAEGLVESRAGVGTFVRRDRVPRASDHGWQTAALGTPRAHLPRQPVTLRTVPNDVVSLHAGYPDRELLPERLIRSAIARAARQDQAVTRAPSAGLPELQAWFAHQLAAAAPAGVTPPAAGEVIIFPGSQNGLGAAFRSLVGPEKTLLLESPTYWGAITAATQSGVRVVPVPSGPDGPDPEALARTFEQTGARAFYAQPTFANPDGASWSPERGDQVLDVVRAAGAFLIEDDWAHDFGITADAHPLAAREDAGHVVYLRSLTKSLSPSLRVAALVARGPAHARILACAQADSLYVSGLLQSVALDVVSQPGWRTHLRGLRRQLLARDLLADAIADHLPAAELALLPQGGLNLWVRLPDATDLDQLVTECEHEGVLVAGGSEWFPAEPTAPYLRLNFAGPQPAAYPGAVRTISRALERQLGR